MSLPGLGELLHERDPEMDANIPGLTDEGHYLLSHLVTAGALLLVQRELYPELLARLREEGSTEEVRADAQEMAELIAAVMQSARRRQDLLAGAQETRVNPAAALGLLDQVFFSLCLLTEAEDDSLVEIALGEGELEALFDALDVQEWLEQLGVSG